MGRKPGDTLIISKARRAKALQLLNDGLTVTEIWHKMKFYDYAHAYRSLQQAIRETNDESAKLYRARQQDNIDRDLDLLNRMLYPEDYVKTTDQQGDETETIVIGGITVEDAPKISVDSPLLSIDEIKGLLATKYTHVLNREAKLRGLDKGKDEFNGNITVHVVEDDE